MGTKRAGKLWKAEKRGFREIIMHYYMLEILIKHIKKVARNSMKLKRNKSY